MLSMSRYRLSPSSAFDSTQSEASLSGRSARSAVVALSSQGVRLGLTVLGTAILSRLLTPQDFGLVAMVAVVVGFAQVFRDAGLSTPTVQSPTITGPQISNVFWVNISVLSVLGGVLVLTAPLTARFYSDLRLVPVIVVLAIAFVLNGLSVIHEALLRRHLLFPSLGIAQIAAQTIGLVVMVTAAASGAGYWSLVYGTLTSSVASTILVFAFCPWLPSPPRRGVGSRHMMRSGVHLSGFNLVNYFAKNADFILIGRALGALQLGLYSKAFQISMLPMSQIRVPVSEVALPILSSLIEQPVRYRKYFEFIVLGLAALAFPIGAYFVLEAELIVHLVLGPQWNEAIPVFRVLSAGGAVQSVAAVCSLALMSHGYTARYLRLGVISGVVTVGALVIGLQWGIIGVAYGYTLSAVIILFITSALAFRETPIPITGFFMALLLPFSFALVALTAGLVVSVYGPTGWGQSELAVSAVFVAVYFGLAAASKRVRGTLSQMIRAVRDRSSTGGGDGQ